MFYNAVKMYIINIISFRCLNILIINAYYVFVTYLVILMVNIANIHLQPVLPSYKPYIRLSIFCGSSPVFFGPL